MPDLTTLAKVKRWLNIADKPITGITKTNPGIVTCNNHNLPSGKQVVIFSVSGMTQVNENTYTISVEDDSHFTIDVDTTNFTAYGKGGFVGVDDVILQELISDASAWIKAEVARPLFSQSFSETYSGKGNNRLMLRNSPITAVTSLFVNGNEIQRASSPQQAGYTFDDMVIYLNGYQFYRDNNNIVVNYTAGWLAGDTMLDLADRVCVRLVALAYKERERIGQKSVSLGGQTVSFDVGEMPAEVNRMINRLQKVSLS